jgi:hypothetical protein
MSQTKSTKTNVALWTVQVLLAGMFIFAGGMKLFIHTIGVLEVLGVLGVILPGILRLRSSLTPLAAAGLIIIMSGAIGVTVATAPITMAAMPFAVGCLALFVAYGRTRLVPLVAKSRRAETVRASTSSILHRAA